MCLHLRKAIALLSNKDYDESLNEFALAEKAVEVSKPMLTVIHALKGYSHFCRMDYKKSERCYTEALRLSPFDSTSLSRRLKQFDKAAFDLHRLTLVQPESIRVAALLLQLKEKALEEWNQQFLRDPFRENPDKSIKQDISFQNLKEIDRVSKSYNKVKAVSLLLPHNGHPQGLQTDFSKLERTSANPRVELQQLQIHSIPSEDIQQIPLVIPKHKKVKKSILKCSIAYRVPSEQEPNANAPLDPKRIQDIDGKTIESSRHLKSLIEESQFPNDVFSQIATGSRKSGYSHCIATNSKSPQIEQVTIGFSFGSLDRSMPETSEKKTVPKRRESSGDESNEYNIFGDKQSDEINEQLQRIESYVNASEVSGPGLIKANVPQKSILKRQLSRVREIKSTPTATSPKKSVLFK